MKLSVDHTLCQASGMCTGLAPDALQLDESGSLVLLDEHPAPRSRRMSGTPCAVARSRR